MCASRNVLFRLLFILVLLPIGMAGPASAGSTGPGPKMPESLSSMAQHIELGVRDQGFRMLSGYVKLYTKADCEDYSYPIMGTCYGNNPAAPYVQPIMPAWPDEYIDPATVNAFGKTDPGYSASYRLDPREAILIAGTMPPPAAYLGLQTYLNTRMGTFDTTSPQYRFISNTLPSLLSLFFATVPGNPNRLQMLASIDNAINNVVITDQSGAAFNTTRYFIITPDQYMDRSIRQVLEQNAVPAANIFTEPISSTLRTGLAATADDFITLMRYAMPDDGGGPGTPSDKWRNGLPLIVLRIRDVTVGRQPEVWPPLVFDTRTGMNEKGLAPNVKNLLYAVSDKWQQTCQKPDCSDKATSFMNWQPPPINLFGPLCTPIGMNCLGDTQDTFYQISSRLPLDNREVYAVAGPLGTVTGNATYVGLGLNSSLRQQGLDNVSSSQLVNTALAFSTTVTNTEQLYLYYFTRDCSGLEGLTGANCLSVPTSELPSCVNPSDPKCDRLVFSLRDYIRPGTHRGPDAAVTLPPMLLRLRRPSTGAHALYMPLILRNWRDRQIRWISTIEEPCFEEFGEPQRQTPFVSWCRNRADGPPDHSNSDPSAQRHTHYGVAPAPA